MSWNLTENPNPENRYEIPEKEISVERSNFWRRIVSVGFLLAIFVVLIGVLLPARRSAPEAGKRMTCQKNIRELGLSSHIYQSSAGPEELSDQTVNSKRRSVHGWRTLVSFTGESDFYLYAKMKLAKPRPSPEF